MLPRFLVATGVLAHRRELGPEIRFRRPERDASQDEGFGIVEAALMQAAGAEANMMFTDPGAVRDALPRQAFGGLEIAPPYYGIGDTLERIDRHLGMSGSR